MTDGSDASAPDEALPSLSSPSLTRQRLESIPAVGVVFRVSWAKRRRALRDSAIIFLCGSIGIWLPLLLHYGIDAESTFRDSLLAVVKRGDVFILIPSLLAPLYLVLASLKENSQVRRHQVGLVTFSAIVSLMALFFWGRVNANTIISRPLIIEMAFTTSFAFLLTYIYYLMSGSPDNALTDLKNSSKALTTQVLQRRRKEGKL